jgi:ATP-dependent helicase HrpA
VRHALVDGDWNSQHLDKRLTAFERRNLDLRRRLEKVEERERRRDILVGDEAVFAFYDSRLPHDVFDVRSFETWWRDASPRTPRLLDMTEADLQGDASRSDERAFPGRWQQGDQVLSLAYRFEPGSPEDGVSVVVPLPLLAALRPDGFDWQVPGLRAELMTALLKALPKAIRRHVVPAADWAAKLGDDLASAGPEHHDGLPPQTLRSARRPHPARGEPARDRRRLRPRAGARTPSDDVPGRRPPRAHGRHLRDLAELQRRLAGRAREQVARTLTREQQPAGRVARASGVSASGILPRRVGDGIRPGAPQIVERDGILTWDLGTPEVVDTKVAGGVVRGYPALVDEKDAVALRIESTPERAARLSHAGVRRLLLLAVPSPSAYVLEHLTAPEKLSRGVTLPVRESAHRGCARRRRGRGDGARRPGRCPHARAVRRRPQRPVVGRGRRTVPGGLSDGTHPDAAARRRACREVAERHDAAGCARRRESAAQRAHLPRIHRAHRP